MRRLSTRSEHDFLMDEEEHYRRFLDEKAQTIRFFEGLGQPLSSWEIGILVEEEDRLNTLNTFLSGDGKEGGLEGLDLVVLDDKRACAECRYFAAGRFSAYCYEFHRPREVEPEDAACEWFGGRR